MNKLFERTFKRGHYEYGYLQGNLWLKVFYHSYKNKALFAGEEEAKYIISKDKYSIFANITDAFKVDNKFEFIIHYPDDNVSFRWFQNKNPIDELETSSTTASGFEDRGSTVQGFKWGGLVKTNLTDHDQINSFLNGNPGHYYWYFAIGIYNCDNNYVKRKQIPAIYDGVSSSEYDTAHEVTLLLRIHNILVIHDICICGSTKFRFWTFMFFIINK